MSFGTRKSPQDGGRQIINKLLHSHRFLSTQRESFTYYPVSWFGGYRETGPPGTVVTFCWYKAPAKGTYRKMPAHLLRAQFSQLIGPGCVGMRKTRIECEWVFWKARQPVPKVRKNGQRRTRIEPNHQNFCSGIKGNPILVYHETKCRSLAHKTLIALFIATPSSNVQLEKEKSYFMRISGGVFWNDNTIRLLQQL